MFVDVDVCLHPWVGEIWMLIAGTLAVPADTVVGC